MAVEIIDYSALDPNQVAAVTAELQNRLSTRFPSMELRYGVLRNFLLQPSAVHETARQQEVANVIESDTIAAILDNPTVADDATVDKLISNFRITRAPAARSAGQILIEIQTLSTTTIPAGSIFSAGPVKFTTATVFTGRVLQQDVVASTDRLITPSGNGTFVFTIDVTAIEPGPAGDVPLNTLFVMQNPVRGLIRASANNSFSGGANAETNEELVARVQAGITTPGTNSVPALLALFRSANLSFFPVFKVAGFGAPEQLRDKRGLLPGSRGGRVDVFVRTTAQITQTVVTVSATWIDSPADNLPPRWQATLPPASAPAAYEIAAVRPTASPAFVGTFQIDSLIYGFDATKTAADRVDIRSALEAAFTRYETLIVRFRAPANAGEAIGSTRQFDLVVTAAPNVDLLQGLAVKPANMSAGSDCVIRAATPCFVAVSCGLKIPTSAVAPDPATIANAIALAINESGITGVLPTAPLVAATQAFLPPGGYVAFTQLSGRIRAADGSFIPLSSNQQLTVPYLPAKLVTANTVAFFTDPASIAVSTSAI